MPQVNDDVELTDIPDRCGYAFSPGWAVEVSPAHVLEVAPATQVQKIITPAHEEDNPDDPDNPIQVPAVVEMIDIPAVTIEVPAKYASTPPKARVLRLGLTEDDLVNHEATIADLEAKFPEVRAAWGCPPETLLLAAYRFEV